MAWEALNNIAAAKDRPLVIVVNDNERSYAPTIGGLANHLATLRTTAATSASSPGARTPAAHPGRRRPIYETLHGAKKGLKDVIAPQGMFEDLGLKYVGPIDGHDIRPLESALRRAKRFGGPVIVHCLTEKGRGYQPGHRGRGRPLPRRRRDPPRHRPADRGRPARIWTSVFGDEMVALGEERADVVAHHRRDAQPGRPRRFADAFPDRVFDVGIAEQHAVSGGRASPPAACTRSSPSTRPSSTAPSTRSSWTWPCTSAASPSSSTGPGVTGTDGASHNGMWDMSIPRSCPGLRIAAPRDADQVRAQLREAVDVDDAPTVVRFSKGAVGPRCPPCAAIGGMDVLCENAGARRATCSSSASVPSPRLCLEIAGCSTAQGIVTRRRPALGQARRRPSSPLAARHRRRRRRRGQPVSGGVGSAVAQALRDADVDVPVRDFGIPPRFLDHASRGQILAEIGLTGRPGRRRPRAAALT